MKNRILFFTAGKIGSHSSHVSNIHVKAPGKFVIDVGFLCTMKSHSSQVKQGMHCLPVSQLAIVSSAECDISPAAHVLIFDIYIYIYIYITI